ncbi:MAG: ABC transporter ATP-binding protein, partial [Lautropia sp.]
LLLDEPSLGLSPRLTHEVLERVGRIAAAGTAVLIAEQNVRKALEISQRAYLIQLGRVVRSGRSSELIGADAVADAFLGEI